MVAIDSGAVDCRYMPGVDYARRQSVRPGMSWQLDTVDGLNTSMLDLTSTVTFPE